MEIQSVYKNNIIFNENLMKMLIYVLISYHLTSVFDNYIFLKGHNLYIALNCKKFNNYIGSSMKYPLEIKLVSKTNLAKLALHV